MVDLEAEEELDYSFLILLKWLIVLIIAILIILYKLIQEVCQSNKIYSLINLIKLLLNIKVLLHLLDVLKEHMAIIVKIAL